MAMGAPAVVQVPVEGQLVFGVPKSFRVHQKYFSFTGAMEVTDADLGTKVFKVKPKLLSLLDEVKITDMNDNMFLRIEQQFSLLSPTFRIRNRHGQDIAECHKKISFTQDKFKVRSLLGPDLDITGNWWNHEFTIKSNGSLVAEVSRAWYSWTDSYALRVQAGVDCALCLAVCVIIDRILHDREERR